jgi:hypothetical protein
MKKLATPVLLALGVSIAWAGATLNPDASFPALPCHDGWAACILNGVPMSSEMVGDSQGTPQPSDLRVGWFDLKGTAVLSPFTTLSDYSKVAVQPVAVAVASPPPSSTLPSLAPDRTEPLPASGAPPIPMPQTGSSTPPPAVSSPPPSSATAYSPPVYVPVTEAPVAPPPVIAVAPPPVLTPPPVEPPPPVVTPPPQPAVVAEAPAPVDNSCDNLVNLEPTALMGQLSPGQRECLEGRLSSATKPTEKDKVSRVLLTDADARSDRARWMSLAKRHLEDIDRSDPDLCMTYATRLASQGVDRAHGVIRWADYALENKHKWSGATYTSRVNALLKLRAEAANKLWLAADKTYVENRTAEAEEKSKQYRNMTKDFAREWLDYARASGQNIKNAFALCVSASGNQSFCEGK